MTSSSTRSKPPASASASPLSPSPAVSTGVALRDEPIACCSCRSWLVFHESSRRPDATFVPTRAEGAAASLPAAWCGCPHGLVGAAGRQSVNVLPRPGSSTSSTRPPWRRRCAAPGSARARCPAPGWRPRHGRGRTARTPCDARRLPGRHCGPRRRYALPDAIRRRRSPPRAPTDRRPYLMALPTRFCTAESSVPASPDTAGRSATCTCTSTPARAASDDSRDTASCTSASTASGRDGAAAGPSPGRRAAARARPFRRAPGLALDGLAVFLHAAWIERHHKSARLPAAELITATACSSCDTAATNSMCWRASPCARRRRHGDERDDHAEQGQEPPLNSRLRRRAATTAASSEPAACFTRSVQWLLLLALHRPRAHGALTVAVAHLHHAHDGAVRRRAVEFGWCEAQPLDVGVASRVPLARAKITTTRAAAAGTS